MCLFRVGFVFRDTPCLFFCEFGVGFHEFGNSLGEDAEGSSSRALFLGDGRFADVFVHEVHACFGFVAAVGKGSAVGLEDDAFAEFGFC